MATPIAAAVLVLGIILLWTGRQRLEFSSLVATLLSVLELVGFLVSAYTLGWVGVGLVIGVSLVALLVWSLVLAARNQSILVNASVQAPDLTVVQAKAIWTWMKEEKSFAAIEPLVRAELIKALAIQARSEPEIRAMSVPIAQLALIFECDPLWLAPRFDQLLRLYGHPAENAVDVADTLTASTQRAAASFEEMVEAMLTVAGVETRESVEATEAPDDTVGREDLFRESLRAAAEIQLYEEGEKGVRLNGGPMDGWLVKQGAPSLRADWYKTWPAALAFKHEPGSYQLTESGSWADWVPI